MAQVPLMTGEIGQDDCGSDFIKEVMTWLDTNGGHYAAWVWNTWGDGLRQHLPDHELRWDTERRLRSGIQGSPGLPVGRPPTG